MTDVSVCVVNFNGRHCLPACLDALGASSMSVSEIIVVDNASTDGSAEIIEQSYRGVKLIRREENRGPPVARNVGFSVAQSQRVLFIDNDVSVAPDCIERLSATMDETRAAVVMPRVCYAQRRDIIQYDGANCHPLGLMVLSNQDRPVAQADSSVRFMNSVVTACILVDRAHLTMPELFDEDFFFNYEDHDFGLRCSVAGAKIASAPEALCYHGSGTDNLSFRAGGAYARRRVYCLIRNRWLILLKIYRLRTLIVLLPVLFTYELFQFVGVTARGWLGQWLAASWWVLTHARQIRRKRRSVQATRRRDDFPLFEAGPLPFTSTLTRGRLERVAIGALDRLILGYWRLIRPIRSRFGNPH